MNFIHVDGKEPHKIILYALSTCVWCKRTKQLLDRLELAYDYIDMDLLSIEDQEPICAEIERWRGETSFPTLVIDDRFSINGYRPEEITVLKDPS